MPPCFKIPAVFLLLIILATAPQADNSAGGPIYKPTYDYPVLEEISAARKARQAIADSLQELVDERYREMERMEKEARRKLRLDWSGISKPASPDAFAAAFHLPPVPQYATGTCWAFCSTSFFESEVHRLTGQSIKLSEMWTVYWEYIEKARRFIREYGHSHFSQGSQDSGTREVYRVYGAVPAATYDGLVGEDERYDHSLISKEIRRYLDWVAEHGFWDEEKAITYVRLILDKHMGRPPEEVVYGGRTYTPRAFLREVLMLEMDDYVTVISTLHEPFGEWTLLDYADNWRRLDDFLNLPLDDFYTILKDAVRDGYSVSLGGDVSEPGLDGMEDAAYIPSWDIPAEYIDQASREYRIESGLTGDDHGIHLVGYLEHEGLDWFLIKDSNRSSRLGQFKGYYFYTGDYIKLKMLSYMIHRERLADTLPRG